MMLALFPAILMALAIVREKELGSITNLYVTPVTRLEFLLGKQLPYVAVAMVNFCFMLAMALFVFQVPLKGSFLALLAGTMIYVFATTGYGMLISTFCSTQIAALFGTAILTILPAKQFSGMMTPVSSLSGIAADHGSVFPMSYFRPISVGTFTKGLGFADLGRASDADGVHSGSDCDQPVAASQTGTIGAGHALPLQYLLAWHQGASQLLHDCVLLGFVIYSFSLAVISQAQSNSQELYHASIAVVDEDHSELSRRITHAFLMPYFKPSRSPSAMSSR